MDLSRHCIWGGTLLLAVGISITGAQAEAGQRCELLNSGVEYRSFMPDGRRYVYISVKVLSGYQPSIFVMIDKNYITARPKPVKDDSMTAWWLDRSKPFSFSSDKVSVRWKDRGGWHAVTSWFSDPDWAEISQPIRGIEPDGSRFLGMGSPDTNNYAFQTRIELQGFRGDEFDVVLPSISYDGTTVTPPVVHFARDEDVIQVKC